MRYLLIDDIQFTDINSRTVTIKDMREYEEQEIISFLNLYSEKYLDEIATRPEFYGDDLEFESYKIADQNIVKLFDAGFDMSKIKKLEIPR